MASPFHSVGVIGKYDSANLSRPLEQLIDLLQARGLKAVLDSRSAVSVASQSCTVVPLSEIGAHCDLVLVVGGDGTLLSVAREIAPYRVPLIGVNLGRLGFLTDIPVDSMQASLGAMLDGAFVSEERTLLQAKIVRLGKEVFSTLALNDVVVAKGATVDARDASGSAPIDEAAWRGYAEMVQFLIDHGADVKARNRDSVFCII